MMPHPIETILNNMIAVDTRPANQRNLASAGSGRKRTTIVGATVKSITQAQVDNAGITVWGVLKQQPMTRAMFRQGPLADCYLLASCIALTLDDPNWSDDIIIPIDAKTVIVQYYFAGNIVQIKTSLEVSTAYNNPSDDDVRIELLEKTYGLLRSGISDYTKANWGNGLEAFQALGRLVQSVSPRTPAMIDTLRAQKKGVICVTGVGATKVTARHALCLLSGAVYIDPWNGAADVPIDQTTIMTSSEIAGLYAGSLPNPKILVKPPTSTPTTPAPSPEVKPMIDFKFVAPNATTPAITLDANNKGVFGIKVGETFKVKWITNADSVWFMTGVPGWGPTEVFSPKDGLEMGYPPVPGVYNATFNVEKAGFPDLVITVVLTVAAKDTTPAVRTLKSVSIVATYTYDNNGKTETEVKTL